MRALESVTVNGYSVWAYVVELEGGLRVRLALDEWEHLRRYRGQQVEVQRDGRDGERLLLTDVTEVPPVVWVVPASRAQPAIAAAS